MRILMTSDAVGGVWTYSLELARALGGRGVDVTLATMGPLPTSEQQGQAREIGNIDLRVSEYKLEWMDDPWDDVALAGEWLMSLVSDVRPDLVHLNGYCHGALDWSLPVLVVGHSCVLSWWEAVKGEPAPESWERYRREVTQGLRGADMVIAPSRAMLNALDRHYSPFVDTRVVPNGRDAALFMPGAKQPLVFGGGRVWDEAKNMAALQAAAGGVAWPVCIAGGDDVEQDVPNVRHLGRLAPQVMPYWYARSSIYVLPAKYEPFGLSALEAALAGCVLVLGDIDSLREIWGSAAVYVEPDNVAALEQALSDLIADDQLRSRMALAARNRALRYTPGLMARGYLDAYQDLLGEYDFGMPGFRQKEQHSCE